MIKILEKCGMKKLYKTIICIATYLPGRCSSLQGSVATRVEVVPEEVIRGDVEMSTLCS